MNDKRLRATIYPNGLFPHDMLVITFGDRIIYREPYDGEFSQELHDYIEKGETQCLKKK